MMLMLAGAFAPEVDVSYAVVEIALCSLKLQSERGKIWSLMV